MLTSAQQRLLMAMKPGVRYDRGCDPTRTSSPILQKLIREGYLLFEHGEVGAPGRERWGYWLSATGVVCRRRLRAAERRAQSEQRKDGEGR